MIEMHELMHEYYQYALLKTVEGEEALNYLTKRGFTEELIKSRGIGYAPNHTHFCHDFYNKKVMIYSRTKLVFYREMKKISAILIDLEIALCSL